MGAKQTGDFPQVTQAVVAEAKLELGTPVSYSGPALQVMQLWPIILNTLSTAQMGNKLNLSWYSSSFREGGKAAVQLAFIPDTFTYPAYLFVLPNA